MNLTQAQIELDGRGFDYLTPSRKTIMLNDAKNAFEDVWEFPWLYKVSGGPPPLTIPDLKYVLSVKSGFDELLGIDIRQLAQGATDLAQTGAPEYWYLDADVGDVSTMRTWPVSTAPLTVVHVIQSPELVDANDTPLIPARYHPLWIDFAVLQAYQDSDNYIAAQALQADIGARMQAVIERYETRNRQHAAFIGQRGFSEDD